MKKFSQFISEAKSTLTSQRASKMGLQGDGHGGWYNASGEFVAKTVGGDLKFFNKGQKPGRDVPQKPQPKPQVSANPKSSQLSRNAKDQTSTQLTVVFGKFNPPTKWHEQLLRNIKSIAKGSDLKIYPSRSKDKDKNPIPPDTKVEIMKVIFPEFEDNIINDHKMVSIVDVLQAAQTDGYKKVTIAVDSNRLAEFRSIAVKYNGQLYNFDDIEVVSGGERGSELESSEKMRSFAANNNYTSFRSGLPSRVKDEDAKALFQMVRSGMGVKGTRKEDLEMWKIAPKLDYVNLRENYISHKIFKLGDIVENINTGMSGKIIRRGTNYLICLSEDNIMFKSWITDVTEKANFTNVSGVPADQREVGTDEYRKYTMKMSGLKKIRNFINKYKTKK
jgi:hypothetical protein